MDAHLKSYPILSYVLDRLPSIIPLSSPAAASAYDVEQPPSPKPQPEPFVDPLVEQMPHLKDPKVIAAMAAAVSEIAQTRSVLAALGERPDHETVDQAKAKVAEIDSTLCNRLEEVELSSRPPELDQNDWKAHLADKEKEKRDAAEKEKQMYKSIIQLDEMHESYQKLLKNAEAKLTKIYDNAAMASENDKGKGLSGEEEGESSGSNTGNNEEVNEEVVGILAQNAAGNGIDKIDLSGRRLKLLPEAIGKIRGLVALNLCNNQLEV